MKLYLNNVGIIKDSEIQLDGLTVITGKNSSGKTTVGRALYSLICAGNNTVEAFEDARRRYVCSQLLEVERLLQIRRITRMRFQNFNSRNGVEEALKILATHHFMRFEDEELLGFLSYLRGAIRELTPDQYREYFLSSEKEDTRYTNSIIETVYNNFFEWREKALYICQITLDIVSDEKAFYNFIQDRTSAYLNHEFNDQIQPVRARGRIAKIILSHQGKTIVDIKVKNKNLIGYSWDSTFVYPYSNCIFIGNPFVVDKLQEYNDKENSLYHSYTENHSETMISSDDIDDHDEVLIKLLMQSEKHGFFDDIEIKRKYDSVFEKINDIVPGEFYKNSNGVFYVRDGARLHVNNLATGSKMFFIIKKLLLNGLINENTVLVLDEPESHLHPEWINKFAEILVVLIKDVKVNVLLTTHSPNLMLALDYYSKKSQTEELAHFYLAHCDQDKYYSHIECIDNRIGEGYSHLSLPLIEMNVRMEGISDED